MILHLGPPPPSPPPRVAEVYARLREEFGDLPEPITLHTPVPGLLSTSWATLRETLIADGRVPRRVKEAMALAISTVNRCAYCIDAHALQLHALGAGSLERELGEGGEPSDPELAAFVSWARASGRARAVAALEPPFAPEQAPEAIGTALCFHYINRMVTVLLSDSPLPATLNLARPVLRQPALALASRRFRRAARGFHEPGKSLSLFAPVPPDEELAWAAPAPAIAGAFAAFAAAVESAAAPVLEPATRRWLREQLADWQGAEPPLLGGWLEEPLAQVSDAQRPAARLALLAARAPTRLEDEAVAAFRSRWPGDAALVAVLAWGSHEAARRIATWLAPR